ncbi:CASC3-like protein [Mya arenaria]|uniref:Protein CASC3 n=1 Tax=Mya arenaria TaxID=6604 RepID=A0ABY7ELK2_MYAAR|nr:CASC3-like protein [Mya arenaria]
MNDFSSIFNAFSRTSDSHRESEGEHTEPTLSEYESTADESRYTETEGTEDSDEYVTEEEETAEEESDGEEKGDGGKGDGGKGTVKKGDGDIDGERQSGDGEEQPKLDDDEDRQNPAYIPRRGAFYEHDMRLDPNDKKIGNQSMIKNLAKGKLWKDDSKWGHDKFDAYDQAPKSRQELIAIRGGRDRKQQFQDFLPEDGNRRSSYGNPGRGRYGNDNIEDDRGPRSSKSDSYVRGGRGGGRGFGRDVKFARWFKPAKKLLGLEG